MAKCANLRTRIVVCNGTSVQVVVRDPAPCWLEGPEGVDDAVEAVLDVLQREPMGYGAPLCRYALVTKPNSERYFVWAVHHAVYDGWTMQLVLSSLFQLYHSLSSAEPRLLPYAGFVKHTMDMSSGDGAAAYWSEQLRGVRPTALPWSSSSAHSAAALRNTGQGPDKSSTATTTKTTKTFSGRKFQLPLASSAGISVTKASVLRAAWALVLGRYSESGDVCFGATVTGRQAAVHGVESMAGPAIATVPIRVRLQDDEAACSSPAVGQFLEGIQSQAAKMVRYEQFGLQHIAKLGPDVRDACNFSSLLVIQPVQHFASVSGSDKAQPILQFGAAEQTMLESSMGNYFNYPLVVTCEMGQEDDVGLRFYYDEAVLNEAQLTAMAHHMEHVVHQLLCADQQASLASISLVGPWDLQQAVQQNVVPAAVQSCTHWLFQTQVKSRPEAPAIHAWDADLTYTELEALASRLASKLRQLGVGPEAVVPLCFAKSAWAVVSLVAVQLAGAAFVLLDPAAPSARIKTILDDVHATVALTAPEFEPIMRSLGVHHAVVVDPSALESLPAQALSDPASGQPAASSVQPTNASFVIFTSGSTGKPKGIVLDHRAACTAMEAYGSAVGIGPGTRVFQFSSFVFDMGVYDMLVTLTRGGCVCMPSEHDRVNNLAHAMDAMEANFVFLTPTVADLVAPAAVPRVRTLVLGGEAIAEKTIDRWARQSSVYGLYGPAETSMSALNLRLGRAGRPNNLGRPLSSAYWVVEPDDPRCLVPIGCVGELIVQGPMLARGHYVGVPSDGHSKASAASGWIDHAGWLPGGHGGGRAYRTGDLVRRNEDGTFDYIGRKDTQVKINGQRVELGEVEARMLEHLPEHMTGLVDVVPASAEHGRRASLTAFLWVLGGGRDGGRSGHGTASLLPEPSGEEARLMVSLHGFLGVSLPTYMVPMAYLCLQGEPEQTASGKVSRRHLIRLAQSVPAAQMARFTPGTMDSEAPSLPMELALRDIWAQVLGVDADQIGKYANFFRLGGDSITAIHFVTAARQQDIDLTVANVFQDPRLAILAALAASTRTATPPEQGARDSSSSSSSGSQEAPFALLPATSAVEAYLPHIASACGLKDTETIQDAYPCSPAQSYYMALSAEDPLSSVAKHIFKLADTVDLTRFKKAWETTVQVCPVLRTRVVLREPSAVGGDPAAIQAVVRDDFHWQQGIDGLALRPAIEAIVSHQMSYGTPLCRYGLVEDTTNGDRFFVLALHHSVFDGWTLGIIGHALNNAYLGRPLVATTPYRDFVQHTASQLDRDAAAAYWREQLRGARPSTMFPSATGPHPNTNTTITTTNGAATEQHRSPSVKARRTHLYKKTIRFPDVGPTSITKATLVRAAWAIMLARHDKTDDVTFGALTAGRNAPLAGLHSMAGPTIALVPVRIRLLSGWGGGPDTNTNTRVTAEHFLQRIQRQAADMAAHEQYGLDAIAALGADEAGACQFRHLVVVQPVHDFARRAAVDHDGAAVIGQEQILASAGTPAYAAEEALQHYYPYPLVLQCYLLGDSTAELNFIYHDGAAGERDLDGVAGLLEHVVAQLQVEGRLLSDLLEGSA